MPFLYRTISRSETSSLLKFCLYARTDRLSRVSLFTRQLNSQISAVVSPILCRLICFRGFSKMEKPEMKIAASFLLLFALTFTLSEAETTSLQLKPRAFESFNVSYIQVRLFIYFFFLWKVSF